MSYSSGEIPALPPTLTGEANTGETAPFPTGAYRANVYVYDPFGRIDWYALNPEAFADGRYFTVGRGADCNIPLNDGSVSTRHATIGARAGQLVLRDLHSTNGTQVNGEPVDEHVLEHGDVVRFGATDARFLLSYRKAPLHLVLDFIEGANAGRSVATFGSSTTVGRLNCAINLHGAAVAPQHVRIDAYGRELMFVVDLARGATLRVNDEPITGIVPASEGDIVQVGEHRFALRVVDARALQGATPQPDGTLLLAQTGRHAADPVAQVSPSDLIELEHHLQALGAAADATAVELPLGDAFVSPTCPPEPRRPTPLPAGQQPRARPTAPEKRWRRRKSAREALPEPTPPPAPPRRLAPWVVALAVAGIVAGGALIPVSAHLELPGSLEPAAQAEVVAPVRGRVRKLFVRAGDEVVAGDVIAHLVDHGVQVELDRIYAEIETLEQGRPGAAPTDAALDRIAELITQRDRLQKRRLRVVRSEREGLVLDPPRGAPRAEAMVRVGEPLVRVVDRDRLRVVAQVPGAWLGTVEAARRAEVLPEGMSDRAIEVEIDAVGPAADPRGEFPLEATVGNADGALRPGQRVIVRVPRPDTTVLGWLWERVRPTP